MKSLHWSLHETEFRARLRKDRPMMVGTVYGALMNHRAEHAALGAAMEQAPYKGAPRAPVLYLKPANTVARAGTAVMLPPGTDALRARACVGLVLHDALAQNGWRDGAPPAVSLGLFADLTIPHDSFFRPPVKFNAFDQSLVCGARQLPFAPDTHWTVETHVRGQRVHTHASTDLVQAPLALLREVNRFIAFEAGDVLLLGCPPDAPPIGPGDHVRMCAQGGDALLELNFQLVAQTGALP